MATACGGFTLCTSRSSKHKYWLHSQSGVSYWHDAALPPEWAWGKDSEALPRYFVNLVTGERLADAPKPAELPPVAPMQQAEEVRQQLPPEAAAASRKRPRPEAEGERPAGPPEPRFPRVWEVGADGRQQLIAACCFGFCEVPPALARNIDARFFREPHQLVLRQLLSAAVRRHAAILDGTRTALARAGRSGEEVEEELSRMTLILHDMGAGGGAATEFLLRTAAELAPAAGLRIPSSGEADPPAPGPPAAPGCTTVDAEVYAQDCWDITRDYYGAQLRRYGQEAVADAWGADPGAASFQQFCANFWGDGRVFPARFPLVQGVQTLSHMGVCPALSYLDADLSPTTLRSTLDMMWTKWMDPAILGTPAGPRVPTLVGGGGWEVSEGVRSAVRAFASDHGLSVHVEQGAAWTFCADLMKETRNDAAAAAAFMAQAVADGAVDGGEVDALTVVDAGARRGAALKVWQAAVFAVCEGPADDGDALEALRAAVGSHGRRRGAGAGAGAGAGTGAGAGDSPSPFAGEAWVDEGGEDKMRLTPLCRAVKANRTGLARALLEEHGAAVNAACPSSRYTALHVAAYAGNSALVAMLLAAGADARAVNKFGEAPGGAQRAPAPEVAALLDAARAAPAAGRR